MTPTDTNHDAPADPIHNRIADTSDTFAEPRLVRRNHGRSHSYTIDGRKVTGVTTALKALPKELKQWAADCAANHAVEHWDELAGLPITKRLDRIRYAYRDVVNAAALRGTQIHDLGEKLVHGEPVKVPDEHRGPVEAYARFLDRWQIEPIATETPVGHSRYGYAGTADLWATIGVRDEAPALVDLKTGKGVYESVALQLAAYRYADLWQPNGPDSETIHTAGDVDLVYVADIGPDDVRMLPVVAGAPEFEAFLYVLQTSRWLDLHGYRGPEPLIGEAETPKGHAA